MRLFVAFDVPEEVVSYLKQIQKQLPDSKLNLVKEFHLTLRFLGEVDEKSVEKAIANLRKIKFEKFTARTASLGVFPSENFIRVVWLGLEPADVIIDLKNKVERVLGVPFDNRFHPHITLARIKFVKNKQEFIRRLKLIKTKEVKFDVNSIKLIKSELTSEGPVYAVVEEVKPQSL